MKLLIDSEDKILFVTKTLNTQSNGNYLIKDDTIAVPPIFVKEIIDWEGEEPLEGFPRPDIN